MAMTSTEHTVLHTCAFVSPALLEVDYLVIAAGLRNKYRLV